MDVFHKEQLVTKEEAEAASNVIMWGVRCHWIEVALNKDVDTATRIADILDKYGFNDVVRRIRGKCVYSHLCV